MTISIEERIHALCLKPTYYFKNNPSALRTQQLFGQLQAHRLISGIYQSGNRKAETEFESIEFNELVESAITNIKLINPVAFHALLENSICRLNFTTTNALLDASLSLHTKSKTNYKGFKKLKDIDTKIDKEIPLSADELAAYDLSKNIKSLFFNEYEVYRNSFDSYLLTFTNMAKVHGIDPKEHFEKILQYIDNHAATVNTTTFGNQRFLNSEKRNVTNLYMHNTAARQAKLNILMGLHSVLNYGTKSSINAESQKEIDALAPPFNTLNFNEAKITKYELATPMIHSLLAQNTDNALNCKILKILLTDSKFKKTDIKALFKLNIINPLTLVEENIDDIFMDNNYGFISLFKAQLKKPHPIDPTHSNFTYQVQKTIDWARSIIHTLDTNPESLKGAINEAEYYTHISTIQLITKLLKSGAYEQLHPINEPFKKAKHTFIEQLEKLQEIKDLITPNSIETLSSLSSYYDETNNQLEITYRDENNRLQALLKYSDGTTNKTNEHRRDSYYENTYSGEGATQKHAFHDVISTLTHFSMTYSNCYDEVQALLGTKYKDRNKDKGRVSAYGNLGI